MLQSSAGACALPQEEEATFKWQQELSSEKARLKTEKSSQVMQFEEQLREKMELEYQAKHKALKEEVQQEGARELAALKQQLEKERDAEIEMVIGKLEDTVVESQKASEASEKAWKEKYARVLQEKEALSAREEQLQDEVARLTATLLQRQTETEACQKALQEAKEDHEFALKELQVVRSKFGRVECFIALRQTMGEGGSGYCRASVTCHSHGVQWVAHPCLWGIDGNVG